MPRRHASSPEVEGVDNERAVDCTPLVPPSRGSAGDGNARSLGAPETNGAGGDSQLRSVSIAMDVLACFTSCEENGASDVARQLNIAKSTASRMLAALAVGGLLERRTNGRYRLGLRLFEYGQLAADRLLLKELGLPIMADLRDRFSETVQLGIPFGAEVLYVDRLEGTHGLRFHTEAFRRVPGHSSSSGKAIAAFNPFAARAIANAGLRPHTPYTIVDPARFRAVLEETKTRGWACSEEEFEVGLSSVAAPVLVNRGDTTQAVAALSVAGPTQRVLRRRQAVATAVVRAAQQLSDTVARAGSIA